MCGTNYMDNKIQKARYITYILFYNEIIKRVWYAMSEYLYGFLVEIYQIFVEVLNFLKIIHRN